MQSLELRILNSAENLEGKGGQGQKSNCRHENFQSRDSSGTIRHHW